MDGVTRKSTSPPVAVPDLRALRQAIPPSVFRPSILKSFAYLVWDVTLCTGLYFLWRSLLEDIAFTLFPVYWFWQGTLFWALFIVGHDCGHNSFSSNKRLNFIVGTIVHSSILVPFSPWQLSHRSHHAHTGNYEKDEIFYPLFIDSKGKKSLNYRALWVNCKGHFLLGLGFPIYLIFGTGITRDQKGEASKSESYFASSHFNLYNKAHLRHRGEVAISLLTWGLVFAGLMWYGRYDGWWRLVAYYLIPLFIAFTWLVVITFLHHGPTVPWYNTANWTKAKGNLSTVDRNFGLFDLVTHHICVHQMHHLFPDIPHYHLQAATQHFRKICPDLYRESKATLLSAFIENFSLYAHQLLSSESSPGPAVFQYSTPRTPS